MKKRILSLLTTLVMVFGLTACLPTITASAYYSGDYTYSVSNGKATITGYSGSATSLKIPSELDGYTVVSIGKYALGMCSSLTSVTIPDTVVTIGYGAFIGSSNLISITIPNSVVSIDDYAFLYCTSLSKVSMGNSVKTIGYSSFGGCDSLASIKLPNSVTSLGEAVFGMCSSLTSITIPDSVITIPDSAFLSCTSLTSVKLGSSVKSIKDCAFGLCGNLTRVTIPSSVTSISSSAFSSSDNVVIYGYKNSYAQSYASYYDIPFKLLVPTVSAKSTYSSTTSSVTINWNKVSGASGYRIYKYNSSTKKWVNIKTISGNSTTSYKTSGLSAGKTYKFKVKAYIKDNGTTYWGSASSTITTSTKPTTAKFTTASKTTTAIRLNWKKVTGASGYQIQKYNSSTKSWSTVKTITSGSTLTYRISGLKKGTVYKYRIRAYRTVNSNKLYGAWSATKKVTTKS